MKYVMCDVWCVMCDVPDLIFCKTLTLWVKGRPKTPNLSDFWPFKWYTKIDPRWQSYVHNILQGLLTIFIKKGSYFSPSKHAVSTWLNSNDCPAVMWTFYFITAILSYLYSNLSQLKTQIFKLSRKLYSLLERVSNLGRTNLCFFHLLFSTASLIPLMSKLSHL